MTVIERDEQEPRGPWTLRTRGWGIMPEVVDGFGFERPERVEVVPASHLRGAVDALHEAIDAARLFTRNGMTWREYDALLARLASQHPRGQ